MTDRRLRPLTPETFFARVDQSAGPNGCWPWTGKRTKSRGGYGKLSETGRGFARRELSAHRVALSFALGRPVAADLDACHTCDNPPCCNPAHLYEGTRGQNMADCVQRGRSLAGERSRRRVLSAADVRLIRALRGTRSQVSIAGDFGVHPSTVSLILSGHNWRSVA